MSRTADFHAALADRLPQLLYELLGKPSGKTGSEWRYRRKGSLAVRVDSAKAGQWFDHEAGHGGGFVSLVAHELGCDTDRARDWVAERTGITLSGTATPSSTSRSLPRTVAPDQADLAARAREEAQRILASAVPAPSTHPYLQAKAIEPHDLLIDSEGRLVIGLRDIDGTLHTVQRIDAQGNKRFLAGGAKADHFAVIGDWGEDTAHLLVSEGWATGASIHEAIGEPVIVAFDAGNLQRVTRVLRQRHPAIDITIVADNDDKPGRTDNPGVAAATQAARDNDARLAIPPVAGDANDLVHALGPQALRDCIASARWVAAREPTYPEPRHDVAEARAELAGQIAGFMDAVDAYHEQLLAEPADAENTDTTPVPMLGLPVEVGLGKTSQVREQIIAALAAGRLGGGKVVFAVPRHDLGEEQVEAFAVAGIEAVLWKGRTAPDPKADRPDQQMCRDPEAQADALAAELSVEQAVCRVKRDGQTYLCPHYEVCGYQRQKRLAKSAQVIICAHDSLFHAMPKVIGRPALLVIDEGFWQSGLRGTDSPVQITVDSLDPYDADLRCYDYKNAYDYPETQFLIEYRLKLWKVL
ncbi:MAG: toprim domain-containing protein, partial [Novosphingobium sp.]